VTGRARIAILVSARQIASRELLFLALARRLLDKGRAVAFLAAGPEQALREAVPAGAALHDVAPAWSAPLPHLARMYASVGGLARFLRADATDVLFATSIPPNLVALRAARRIRPRPRILVRHSNVLERPWRPRNRLVPALYPEADAIVAVSRAAAADVQRFPRIRPDRVETIANGVDLAAVARDAAGPAPHPWFADGAGPVVVALGRLVPQKDYPTLLRAFARVRGARPARLIVVGGGPLRRRLEAMARSLGVAGSVAFVGHATNPFPYLAAADLQVLASRSEGMPSALIEGLACGCRIVATDSPGGSAEILDHGRYGRLVPVGDATALADAILAALAEPRAPEVMRARAAAFDLSGVLDRYEAVIDRLIPAGRV
jgi:glycosyltransferase involved in cell wall biosynthesis